MESEWGGIVSPLGTERLISNLPHILNFAGFSSSQLCVTKNVY